MESDEKHNEGSAQEDLLEGLASLPYYERLTRFIQGSSRHWVSGGTTVVDFRPLYAVSIHHHHQRLAEAIQQANAETITDEWLARVGGIIHEYTDTLRDFEFIHANRWNTQFVKDIAASRLDNGQRARLQGAIIKEHELEVCDSHRSLFQDSDLLGSFDHELMQHSTAIGKSLGTGRAQTVAAEERRKHVHIAMKRFGFAIIGGLIIVLPMLILMVGVAKPKTLSVISVSIFLFAVSVAIFSKTEPESLLAATAAYAAVLVALLGIGNTGNQ
ncbi:hypothetical protein VFPPC_14609 [Pochonia chlamydosporia 170]|uniref:DUF6594 domain-containing protein n=1 Tax=Pochonia chlamydosporia 170 TaxID=1380566 RepID=A0A179F8D7_METCM|nr:hypothetical protein VFPPC_14609 [Pochonia chlamydosporia 170]OAQ61688.1 hypothetical protein VFPPC_14609 [Pochonia chlamydosporia 170]